MFWFHLFFHNFANAAPRAKIAFSLVDGHIWLPEAEILPCRLGEREAFNVK